MAHCHQKTVKVWSSNAATMYFSPLQLMAHQNMCTLQHRLTTRWYQVLLLQWLHNISKWFDRTFQMPHLLITVLKFLLHRCGSTDNCIHSPLHSSWAVSCDICVVTLCLWWCCCAQWTVQFLASSRCDSSLLWRFSSLWYLKQKTEEVFNTFDYTTHITFDSILNQSGDTSFFWGGLQWVWSVELCKVTSL